MVFVQRRPVHIFTANSYRFQSVVLRRAHEDYVSSMLKPSLFYTVLCPSRWKRTDSDSRMKKRYQSRFGATSVKKALAPTKQTALHQPRPSPYALGNPNKSSRIAERKIQKRPTPGAARYGIHEMRPATMPADSASTYLWLSFDAYAADGQAAKNHSPWRQ